MQDYIPGKTKAPPKKKRGAPKLSGAPLLGLLKAFLTLAGFLLVLVPLGYAPVYLQGELRALAVQGNRVLSAEAVARRLALPEQVRWWDLDLYTLAQRLLGDPWIAQVDLKKKASLGLLVQLREREPIAFVQTASGLYLIDQELVLLDLPESLGALDLPVLSDPDLGALKIGEPLRRAGIHQGLALMEILKGDAVLPLEAISQILVDDPTNLRLITRPGGLEFRWGSGAFKEKLKRLHLASAEIDRREDRLLYVDLRNPEGVVIKRK